LELRQMEHLLIKSKRSRKYAEIENLIKYDSINLR
jgi:hypothetical protein